ncbi:MAG: cation:proton antiporter [Chloroflexi bacterium]|nr:cation:proton antiporter [Chloroflexota bacterium]MCL5074088.1 cation:proton antiporter [Chloroflexota bacterium]
MAELGLISDLALAFLAALAGGAIAVRLGQSAIIGYLLAGMAIGPFTLRLVGDVDRVRVLAEIGVIFLMFALGVEFSLTQLKRVQRVAIFGGIAQILLTIALGLAIGQYFGWDMPQAAFFGSLIALSSTMVVLKLLMERGELDTVHGRIMLGLLIVQDLSVVPMMVLLPEMAQAADNLPVTLLLAVTKAALFLAATYYLGTYLVPRLLFRIAATKSRELFLLTIVCLALGAAVGTYLFGLTLAFGAFIAGLIVSESDFSHQILAEVLPLRDLFSVLFFVAIGMLINPLFIGQNIGLVIVMVLAIVLGKFLICSLLTAGFGYSSKTAIYVGLGLVQIGEFSFVLARLGVDEGILPDYIYSLTLAGALITILLTPLSISLGPRLLAMLERTPVLTRLAVENPALYLDVPPAGLSQHVVICGYGDVGRHLAAILDVRKFKYLVIDYDPYVLAELRERGVPCIYGDAANERVLAQTSLPKAKLLAVALPDPIATDLVIRNALRLNPKLDIIARAEHVAVLEPLCKSGMVEMVHPKFEAALEMIRHTLHRFGVSGPESQSLVNRLRMDHYRTET